LDTFWEAHESDNSRPPGADAGTQYRSINPLTTNPRKKAAAGEIKSRAQKHFKQRIVTEIVPLTKFYAPKLDHQNYYRRIRTKDTAAQ